jgi:hypothetical protein
MGEREKYDGPLKIESRKSNRENGSAEIKTVDVRVFAVQHEKGCVKKREQQETEPRENRCRSGPRAETEYHHWFLQLVDGRPALSLEGSV